MGEKKEVVIAEKAPDAIGPYSAGIKAGYFVYTAGQAGLNPDSGDLVEGGIENETRQAMENIKAVLEAAGASLESVVKTTVFLRDMNDFPAMNKVYGEFFTSDYPARSTVQVSRIPKDGAVEIEAVALLEG
jgi:2-iminobutanoate/2-iminopropanoate deaminase